MMKFYCYSATQRWSPRGRPWSRGHILKSLASKVEASSPQKMPVLGLRTAIFFELLKFCSLPEKNLKTFFFWRSPKFGL